MEKFTKEELEKFKKLLLEKKAKLEQDLARFAKKDPKLEGDYDAEFPDFGAHQSIDESALEVSDYESNLSLEHNLELQLRNVDEALERITKGTYGRCQQEGCNDFIKKERLEILPEAKYCMRCLPNTAKHTNS